MEIIFTQNAQTHLLFWKMSGNKNIMQKIENLLSSIKLNAYEGIGKPEALKYELAGFWSRRIDNEHRLIYHMIDEETIEIISLRFHY